MRMPNRLNKVWVQEIKTKLAAGGSVRMSTSSRKLFLLGEHDRGLDLQWKSLGSGVWEAIGKA